MALYWHNLNADNDANDRTNYSIDQGGTTPAGAGSLALEDLRFDGTGTGADDDWTLSADLTCLSFDFTGYTGTASTGDYTARANGSITVVSGMILSIGASGWLAMGGSGTLTTDFGISRFKVIGSITCTLSGTVPISSLNLATDGFTITGGTLQSGGVITADGSGTIASQYTRSNNVSINVASTKVLWFTGSTPGSYKITKVGAGEARWSIAPEHGSTDIQAGVVTFQASGAGTYAFGSGTITIQNGAVFWARSPNAVVTISNNFIIENTGGKFEVTPQASSYTSVRNYFSGSLTVRGDVECIAQNFSGNMTSDIWRWNGVVYLDSTGSLTFSLVVGNTTALSDPHFAFAGGIVESQTPSSLTFYISGNRRYWYLSCNNACTCPVVIECTATTNRCVYVTHQFGLGLGDVTIKTVSELQVAGNYGTFGVEIEGDLTVEGTGKITTSNRNICVHGHVTVSATSDGVQMTWYVMPKKTPVNIDFGGRTIYIFKWGLGSAGDKVINLTGGFTTAVNGIAVQGQRNGLSDQVTLVFGSGTTVNVRNGDQKGQWRDPTGTGSEKWVIDASAACTVTFGDEAFLGYKYQSDLSGMTLRWYACSQDAASAVRLPGSEIKVLELLPIYGVPQRMDVSVYQNVWTAPGEASGQVSGLILYGARTTNTDKGRLYWNLSDSGGTRTISLYKDSAKTQLVAEYVGADGTGVVLDEKSGSGLSGTCNLAYTGDDTDSGNIAEVACYVSDHVTFGSNSEVAYLFGVGDIVNILIPVGAYLRTECTSGRPIMVGGTFCIEGDAYIHPLTLDAATAYMFCRAAGTQNIYSTVTLPFERGDAANQLSNWALSGLTPYNSNKGMLYWNLTDSGGTRTVDLYSDAAKSTKVATGSLVGDGTITLSQVGGSGLSGTVDVAYTADDTDSENMLDYSLGSVQETFHTPAWDFQYDNWDLHEVTVSYSDGGRIYWDMEVIDTAPMTIRLRGYMDGAKTVLVLEGTYSTGPDWPGVIHDTMSLAGVGACPTSGSVQVGYDGAIEYGDGADQLDLWYFSGPSSGMDVGGVWYWELSVSGGTATVSVYKDAAKTQLVAQGSAPTGTANTTVTLAEQGGSGVSGSVRLKTATPSSDTDAYNYLLQQGKGIGFNGDAFITESGDTGGNLSSWAISGATHANTYRRKLYWRFTRSGTTLQVDLFKDSSRTLLMAMGQRTGAGSITLAAQNASGLSGSVSATDPGGDTVVDGQIVIGQMGELNLAGAGKNNTNNGSLYWDLTYSGGNVQVKIYSDSGKTVLVASSGSVAYTGEGQVLTLSEQGGSGISGSIKLIGVETPTTDMDPVNMITGFYDTRTTLTGLQMCHESAGTVEQNAHVSGLLIFHKHAGSGLWDFNGNWMRSDGRITLDGGTLAGLAGAYIEAGTRFTSTNMALTAASVWYLDVGVEEFVTGGSAQYSDASAGIEITAPSTTDLGNNIHWTFGGTGIAVRSFVVTS